MLFTPVIWDRWNRPNIPNLTEAAFLLNEPYQENGYTRRDIQALLRRLSDMGPQQVILTGITYEPGRIGAAAYDRRTDRYCEYLDEQVDGYFHGTGDLFASAVLSALMNHHSLAHALEIATRFVLQSIRNTVQNGTDRRFGVDFEHALLPFMQETLR